MRKKFISFILVTVLLLTFSVQAFAYSDSSDGSVSGLPTYKIQANIWLTSKNFLEPQDWTVSAKLYDGTSTATATWIKTAWSFTVSGVGVTIGPVSGSSGGNSISGSWTNNNTWISDYTGTFNIAGIPLSCSGSNTASVYVQQTTGSATASIFRFY